MSKFPLHVLQECIFPHTTIRDPDVLLGSAFGEDVALTRVGNDILASHVDPIVGAIADIGWLAVHVASNDIATSGIFPRWLLLLVLVPSIKDTDLVRNIMMDANRAAAEIGATIIGGHTGYSAGINRPLVAVTALGTAHGKRIIHTGGAKPGDKILITKGIGIEGTAILAEDFKDTALQLGLSEHDVSSAKNLMDSVSVIPEAMILSDNGVNSMHDVTRGGLLETLLEIGHLSNVRMQINMELVTIPQLVKRFADTFHFDPMKMISSGTLVATLPSDQTEWVSGLLQKANIPHAIIGEVLEGTGVVLKDHQGLSEYHQIACEDDELARMWEIYPR